MSDDGIDRKNGTVNLYIICPLPGDSVQIVNCGTHYEVRHRHWEPEPLMLTDDDIEQLRSGEITWH